MMACVGVACSRCVLVAWGHFKKPSGHAHGEVEAFDHEIRLDDASGAHARAQHIVGSRQVAVGSNASYFLEVELGGVIELKLAATLEKPLDRLAGPQLGDKRAELRGEPANAGGN